MAAQARDQGRYLGGRPPYGYRLADAGTHPNKAHAAWGRRAHRLEPDPQTAPVVSWMFAQRLAGHSVARTSMTSRAAAGGDQPFLRRLLRNWSQARASTYAAGRTAPRPSGRSPRRLSAGEAAGHRRAARAVFCKTASAAGSPHARRRDRGGHERGEPCPPLGEIGPGSGEPQDRDRGGGELGGPAADAWYTPRSKVTGGAVPRPFVASCQVSRARRAVEHKTWSGTQPASRSQRPMTGAPRRPRSASGRS